MVIGQLLLVYLLHILILRRHLLKFLLKVLKLDLFGRQLVLQFLVVVAHASQFQLELFADLVHLHALLGLQVDPLLLELVAQLALSVASHYYRLLVAAHLGLKKFLKVRILLE